MVHVHEMSLITQQNLAAELTETRKKSILSPTFKYGLRTETIRSQ